MSKVLLIQPKYRGVMEGRSYTPMGLPYMAAVLEENNIQVTIIDAERDGLDFNAVARQVREINPDVVGLSVLTHALPEVKKTVDLLKDYEIVIGGAHVTADPEIIKDLGVRFGFRGEAEYGFMKLVKHLTEGNYGLEEIEGLVVNEGGFKDNEIFFNERIDELPWPARHLIDPGRYRFNVVFSSRGCPHNCVYCAQQCHKVRYRDSVDVLDEIEHLVKSYGVKEIDFGDSVFTLNRGHVLELCRLFNERKLGVKWNCITRADNVDKELLETMKKCGCDFVSFGVESGVEAIRNIGGKNISDKQLIEAFKNCREVGLRTRGSILFGNPGETVSDMNKSIEFIKELKPDYALFSLTQVFPGTRLFESLVKECKVDRSLWVEFMNEKCGLDYIPDGIDFKEVYEVNKLAFREFYLDSSYLRRKISRLSNLDEVKEFGFLLMAKAGLVGVEDAVQE